MSQAIAHALALVIGRAATLGEIYATEDDRSLSDALIGIRRSLGDEAARLAEVYAKSATYTDAAAEAFAAFVMHVTADAVNLRGSTVLKTIYTITRTPATAPARNTLGYNATTFEVVATSESDALGQAQRMSSYAAREFSWRVTGSRVVLVEDPAAAGVVGQEG